MTFFSSENWPIRLDQEGARDYAGVSNACLVEPLRGKSNTVHIEVPVSLFSFMESVLKVSPKDGAVVRLFLEEVQPNTWMFGVDVAGTFHDLWSYKSRPRWALCT